MKILGIQYSNITRHDAVARAAQLLKAGDPSCIFFLNLDCLRLSRKDQDYALILNSSDFLLPDGIGLRLATWLFGGWMKDNCNGTDFSPLFVRQCVEMGEKIFLLGGKPGVAYKAADYLRREFPGIQIAGTHTGYIDSDSAVIDQINQANADVVFVAMGVPLQEKWITRHRSKLKAKVCLGVGALLDYWSGTIPRAPLWFRKMHLEWLWRIGVDPGRMVRRYLIDGLGFFLFLIYSRFKQLLTQVVAPNK